MGDESEDYGEGLSPRRFVLLCDPLTTPPLSYAVRQKAGFAVRRLQDRESLPGNQFKAVNAIGPGCGEIRLVDGDLNKEWRIFVCLRSNEVIVLDFIEKRTPKTPKQTIELCRRRLTKHLGGE